jgi:hypothetical protein
MQPRLYYRRTLDTETERLNLIRLLSWFACLDP